MNDQQLHHTVIVGGGFGGLWATRKFRKSNIKVTLVDKNNFHLFQPLLYQVATGSVSPAEIASPLRGILAKQKNVSVLLGELKAVDLNKKIISVDDSQLSYDSLIIATGSENHYFGNDSWETKARGLKTIDDALQIRSQIYSSFEIAEKENDSAERKRLLTFIIVGGGPTGVELAGSIAEIAKITLRDNFRNIDPAEAAIYVVDFASKVLNGFHKQLCDDALHTLEHLGIKVLLNTKVEEIDTDGIFVTENNKKYKIESRNVFWAAGVKSSPVGKMLVENESGLDNAGRVFVEADMSLPKYPDVYVIGDLAHKEDKQGNLLPGTAPVAMSQGNYVANKILKKLKGESIQPYKYKNKGVMAVIGRAKAVADLGWIRFSGYPAWLLWLFIHLMYLVGFDNRVLVFIQWGWNYFTRNRGARLITYDSYKSYKKT